MNVHVLVRAMQLTCQMTSGCVFYCHCILHDISVMKYMHVMRLWKPNSGAYDPNMKPCEKKREKETKLVKA